MILLIAFTYIRSFLFGNESIPSTKTISANGARLVDIDIPDSTTNLQVKFAFLLTAAQSIEIIANGALTIKTNSTSSPGQTLVLAANAVVQWATGDAGANPITTSITTLYVSNASGGTVNLKIRSQEDLTV